MLMVIHDAYKGKNILEVTWIGGTGSPSYWTFNKRKVFSKKNLRSH